MTARLIDAAEAERIGLVNRVVAPDELEHATRALVDELLANSHVAVGRAKRVIDASARPALAQTLEMEVAVQEYCVAAARESAREAGAREPRQQGRGGARRRAARRELDAGRRRSAPGAQLHSTGPATSVWLPSGRPRISCTRRAQASSAGRSTPVSIPISCSIETRSSVAMLPVAPGGTGQPPSSPKLDSKLSHPGLERREHVREPLPARVVEVRGQLHPVAERFARRR